jgi:hypothetical protein
MMEDRAVTSDFLARQVAAIERWLRVFCVPGQVVELRALIGPTEEVPF